MTQPPIGADHVVLRLFSDLIDPDAVDRLPDDEAALLRATLESNRLTINPMTEAVVCIRVGYDPDTDAGPLIEIDASPVEHPGMLVAILRQLCDWIDGGEAVQVTIPNFPPADQP